MTYGATAWLHFDAATGTFSGTPTNSDVGAFNLQVTATDTSGASIADEFSLTVENVNDAPVLANAIADQAIQEGNPFTFQIPAETFTDIDSPYGDALTYHVVRADGSALPAWLRFDSATRTFSGTPVAGDAGTLSLKLIATDSGGAQAFSAFAINVDLHTVTGTDNAETLTGTPYDDRIDGLAGNDTLNGGAGNDILDGGAGNDRYVVDNVDDVVIENAGEGLDTVKSSIAYSLGEAIENLTLTGSALIDGTGNGLDNLITGNGANNTLTGGDGNDTLLGGGGADTLIGGAGDDCLDGGSGTDAMTGGIGNDTYVVKATGDLVTENPDEGIDTVLSSITYTLANNVENLILTGTSGIKGTGNALNNVITGNSGNNALNGGAGNDILQGGDGTDGLSDSGGNNLFHGGAGTDTLVGGSGNELYIGAVGKDILTTHLGADVIAFNQGDGQDTINASSGQDNTLSLGGGIQYQDLVLAKSGNNLVLTTGAAESITFANWYAAAANHSVLNLQVIAEAMAAFDATSSDPLLNHKVEQFDFAGLVNCFDADRAANPGINQWALTNALLDFHLSGSDEAAIGGDLAYQYGKNGSLANVGSAGAQTVLADTQFGANPQNFQSLSGLQEGMVKLA